MDDLEQAIADALIDNCYGYDVEQYLEGFAERAPNQPTESDRNTLDVLLSCVGLATALYVIRTRYGPVSKQFCSNIVSRFTDRLREADGADLMVELQQDIVERSRDILVRDMGEVDENTCGYLSTSLLEPLANRLENVDPQSPRTQLWVFTFVTDVAQLTNTILTNAEDKYSFTIGP